MQDTFDEMTNDVLRNYISKNPQCSGVPPTLPYYKSNYLGTFLNTPMCNLGIFFLPFCAAWSFSINKLTSQWRFLEDFVLWYSKLVAKMWVRRRSKCPLLDEAHSQKKFVPKIYSCPHESIFLITILIQKIISLNLFNPPLQPVNKTARIWEQNWSW